MTSGPHEFSGTFKQAMEEIKHQAQEILSKIARGETPTADELANYKSVCKALQAGIDAWKKDINDGIPAPQPQEITDLLTRINSYKTQLQDLLNCNASGYLRYGIKSNVQYGGNNLPNADFYVVACDIAKGKEVAENLIDDISTDILASENADEDPQTAKYKVYISPAGKPIVLNSTDIPYFKSGKSYVPKGSLAGFERNGKKYVGKYDELNDNVVFLGYFAKRSDGKWLDKFDNANEYADLKNKISNDEDAKNTGIPIIAGGLAMTLPSSAFGITNGLKWAEVIGRGSITVGTLGVLAWSLFSSGGHSIYSGEGVISTPILLPVTWQFPIPVTIPIAFPHKIPTTIPNQKPTDGSDCSVYVIWQVMINGNIDVSKYGITCQTNSDNTQNCYRPDSQCIDFNKDPNKNPNILSYGWNWILGGDPPNAKGSKVNFRTALFLEKSITAVYIGLNGGNLPPKHNLPCFKKDDPFNIIQVVITRSARAKKWIDDAINLYGL